MSERLGRLRSWMSGSGVASAIVTRPVSIAYLCGFAADPHERLMALAVTGSGATLVLPELEAENARQAAAGVEIAGWRDGEDPVAMLIATVATGGAVAVEKDSLTLDRAEHLQRGLGAASLEDVAPALRALRAIKSEDEIELLAEAARVTDEVTDVIFDRLRPGVSELEVARWIEGEIEARGCALSFATAVQFGPNSARPHLGPTARRLEPGEMILVDFGAAHRGYRADTTRVAFAGVPGPRESEVHDAVLRANRAGVEAVRPGARVGDVDAAARRVLDEAGFGAAFVHRVGHGLGLEAHEHPSLDPGSGTVLQPGMVVTIEPGAYFPGWAGVRIEDDVVVTAEGSRVLTSAARGLIQIATESH